MPQTLGITRTTYQSRVTEDRVIRAVDPKIWLKDPNVAPLITLLSKMKKRKGVTNPVQETLEQDLTARWAQMSSTEAGTTGSTTIRLADATVVVPGDVLIVPRAVGSAGTYPEKIRVLTNPNDGTNNITVTREFAGTTGLNGTLAVNSALRILGPAYEEGAAVPTAKWTSPSYNTTYTQIIRTACPQISYTDIHTKKYGSDAKGERSHQQMLKAMEHKQQKNAAYLFGKASQATSGGNNYIRTTQGFYSRISTNKFNMGGVVTVKAFNTVLETMFRYGAKEKLLLSCPKLTGAVSAWANSHLQVQQGTTEFGLDVKTYVSPFGKLMIVNDYMLEDGVSGQNGFGGVSFIIDMDQVTEIYLDGGSEYGDTKLFTDVVKDGTHKIVDEYVSETGIKINNEAYHGLIYNVTDYAA